jgi:hypothetical protein
MVRWKIVLCEALGFEMKSHFVVKERFENLGMQGVGFEIESHYVVRERSASLGMQDGRPM